MKVSERKALTIYEAQMGDKSRHKNEVSERGTLALCRAQMEV